ncbi:hypothetical protein ACWEO2_21255 [Nocardia sp. NPDC004278]
MVADAAVEWGQASAGLVEVDFVDVVGAQQRLTLSSCTAVRFEDARPVRRVPPSILNRRGFEQDLMAKSARPKASR